MMKRINLLLRLLLGGVFLLSGVVKIWNVQIKKTHQERVVSITLHVSQSPDLSKFAEDVLNYRVPPRSLNNLVAITLPWVETVAGILMVMGFWLPGSAMVITGLMGVFLVAIGQALARGLDINCGCFGTIEAGKIDALTLARDIGLFVCAAWLYWRASAAESKRGENNASTNRGN